VLAACCVGGARGDNFRFGDIKWGNCFRQISTDPAVLARNGDFYDPRFPEVCADRSSRLRVGFTVTAVWAVGANDNSGRSMLTYATEDIDAFKASPEQPPYKKMCGSLRGCKLRLSRNTDTPTHERRIGYRLGISDAAGVDFTRPSPVPQDAIVSCPVKDGGPSLCPNSATDFDFTIDRLSEDETLVYARYSFEILFPSEGDYTVFFEGCCRPPSSVGDPDIYTTNNYDNTFHLRTGVSVKFGASSLPMKSFRWTMPDIVDLRYLGIKGDNAVCVSPTCSSVSDCFSQFKLQGYHPDDAVVDKVTFRLGTIYEMGKYKCVEHAPLSNPTPTNPNVWVVNTNRCPASVVTGLSGGEVFVPPFTSVQDFDIGASTGIVKFSVRENRVYQMTIMADVTVFDDSRGANIVLSTPLDILVRVNEAVGNDNPPKLSVTEDVSKGFQGVVPATLRSDAISIDCGRPTWLKGAYTKQFLRVGFKDDDYRGTCSNEPQFIEWINQAHDLPKGVEFHWGVAPGGNVTRLNSGGATPTQYGLAYLDLKWTPACEDLSQVGKFQWCFRAKDGFPNSFHPLLSAPSQVSIAGLEDSSCVNIHAVGPPVPNLSPAFTAPTRISACNRQCCACCENQAACPCWSEEGCNTCENEYAETKTTFEYTVHATDSDPFTRVNFELDFPVGFAIGEMYNTLADLNFTMRQEGVSLPRLETNVKYGCGSTPYDDCVSNPAVTADATTKILWTLPADKDRLDVEAFKVCYRAVEEVSPSVDVDLWNTTYGTLPNADSCWVCFMLNVANQPRWLDDNNDVTKPSCESGPIKEFRFAVGQTSDNVVRLEAADTAPNQNIEISVLADPGAPSGATLTSMENLGSDNKEYGRNFVFTPQLGQEDTDYPVCFSATNANGLSSKTCCVRLRVIKGDPLWSFTKVWNPRKACWNSCPWGNGATDECVDVGAASNCPAQGVQEVTVGCSYKMSVAVQLDNAAYTTRLRVQQQPQCDECVPGGIGVPLCGSPSHTNGSSCCGNGMCDGAETGMNCPQDCPMDTATLQPHPSYPNDPSWAEFSFTPSKVQQGRTLLTCIEVFDTTYGTAVISGNRGGSRAPSICMVYRVQSCRYCVPPGATLKSIAQHYLLNVDWVRLYNSNPDIPNPNMLIPSDLSDREPIYIGPRYRVQSGDTLLSIAAVMRTTVKSILDNNPAIVASANLDVGSQLCLLLCSAAN